MIGSKFRPNSPILFASIAAVGGISSLSNPLAVYL